VLAPIPNASVRRATTVNDASLRNLRKAKRKSCQVTKLISNYNILGGHVQSRRDLLKGAVAIAAAGIIQNVSAEEPSEPRMRLQRLSWAGVKIQYRDTTFIIDPLMNTAIWDGGWTLPVVPIEVTTPTKFVLITHAHNDHFDPTAIKAIGKEPGVTVICHEAKASYVSSRGFRVYGVQSYEPVTIGDLTATPVPAVDGFDEFQVSWVVTNGTKRIIHCGDTLWHGGFWKIGHQHGPIDIAFLPVNGAKIQAMKPYSDVEATMTPAQAVAAAVVMGSKLLIPIHYGLNNPPAYVEHPNCIEEMKSIAARRNQPCRVLQPGETLTV
jgi:L-ascorbate metabolism protein UlaG (beta-lactamase superfamily)